MTQTCPTTPVRRVTPIGTDRIYLICENPSNLPVRSNGFVEEDNKSKIYLPLGNIQLI